MSCPSVLCHPFFLSVYLFHTDLLSHHQHVNLGPCCLFASRSHICVILCGYRGSLASSEQLPRCATQITMTTTTTTLITAALTHHHHHHNHHHQQQHALFIYSQRNTFSHNVLLMYNSPFLHNLASHTYPPSSLYCPLLSYIPPPLPPFFIGAIALAGLARDFLDKGRQALEVAFQAQPHHWQTSLLLGCILVEQDQRERAEVALVAAINSQLSSSSSLSGIIKGSGLGAGAGGNNNNNHRNKGGLEGLLEEGVFDGYDSDKLCPGASPVSYAILASFFSLLQRPLPARKVRTCLHTIRTCPISPELLNTHSLSIPPQPPIHPVNIYPFSTTTPSQCHHTFSIHLLSIPSHTFDSPFPFPFSNPLPFFLAFPLPFSFFFLCLHHSFPCPFPCPFTRLFVWLTVVTKKEATTRPHSHTGPLGAP